MIADKVVQRERRILAFMAFGHFFTHFTILVFPALVTTIARDFGAELHVVLSLSLLMYLLYGLSALPWGYLADNWSYRKVLVSGMVMASLGLVMAGLAQNVFLLSVALGAVGLGNGSYHPVGIALLSKGFRNRGRALGFNGVFGNLGIAMGPMGSGILASIFGWRNGLIIIGLTGLVVAVGMLFLPFDSERNEDKQKGVKVKGRWALFLFGILCLTVMFSGLGYRSFTLGLPTWVEHGLPDGLSAYMQGLFPNSRIEPQSLVAAVITGFSLLFGIFGQIAGGYVADKRDLGKGYCFFFGMALVVLVILQFFEGWPRLMILALFSFFLLGAQPIENSLYAVLVPPRWRSSGFGIKFSLAFGMGALAVPILAFLQEKWGIEALMMLVSVYLFFAFGMTAVFVLFTRGKGLRHH